MLENGKISAGQFKVLVILFILGAGILFEPSILAASAKQDAWISAIIGVAVGWGLIWLYTILGSRFPDMTLFEYSERILGKWLGKIVSLLFLFFFFIYLAAHILRNIGDFVATQIMPETPMQFIMIIYLSIVIMGTRLGIEPIARVGEILFPWVLLFFFILLVSLSPELEVSKMKPIFEEGIKPILKGSTYVIAFPYMDSIILLMLFPYVNRTKEAKKAFLSGALIGGLMLILITIYTILVLGADFAARNLYPSYALAKQINIANFFTRIEAVVAGIWFLSIFFKLTICFYVSSLGLAQILNLKEYRPLTIPLGMILLVLSIIISPNMTEFQEFTTKYTLPLSLPFGLFLPMLILVVAVIRGKKGNDSMIKEEKG